MKTASDTLAIVNYFRSKIPVDVQGLALALGIKVREAYLSNNVSGMICKTDRGWEITVNARHGATRKRFTIAHEIGHFVLHRSLIGDGNVDDRAYRSDGSVKNNRIGPREETEANRFAANLLMPADAIIRLQNDGIDNTVEMARRFNVSDGAMTIRLGQILQHAD